jgi:O-antigen ligase
MGSFAFQEKYNGYYPHNMLLEFISELGLIIGGGVILFIVWLFIRLLLRTKKDKETAYMFLYICAFIPMLMVSGTIWCSPMLMFALGFALFNKKIVSLEK